MKTQKLLLLSLCIAYIPFQAKSQDGAGQPGGFLRFGVGARALSLGSAFTALADDPSAGFWNPAGLAQLDQLQMIASRQQMSLDRTYNFVSAAAPFGYSGTLGLSWIGLSVSGIEGRTANTSEPEFLFSNSDNAIILSYALRLLPSLYLGSNAKLIYQRLHKLSAFGAGFDFALLLKANELVRFGLMVQDIGTSIKWSSGLKESFPGALRSGLALNLQENFLVTLDMLKRQQEKIQFAFGAEYNALHRFPLRLGYSRQGFVGGAGMKIPLSSLDLNLDYAYGTDALDGSSVHKISLGITFFKKKKAIRKIRVPGKESADFWSKASIQKRPGAIDKAKPQAGSRKKPNSIKVAARILNVRSGPGKRYARITKVFKGQEFKIAGQSGKWYKIKLTGTRFGWVHGHYVVETEK